ncbi:MAG: hypothetical protein QXM75_02705 [Candidatus Diapherotrites archaeon]
MNEVFSSAIILLVFAFVFFCFFNILFYIAPLEDITNDPNFGYPLDKADLVSIKESGIALLNAEKINCEKKAAYENPLICSADFFIADLNDLNFFIEFSIKTFAEGRTPSLRDCNFDVLVEGALDHNCGIRIEKIGKTSGSIKKYEKIGHKFKDKNSELYKAYLEIINGIYQLEGKNLFSNLYELPKLVEDFHLIKVGLDKKIPALTVEYGDFKIYERKVEKMVLKIGPISESILKEIKNTKMNDWNCSYEIDSNKNPKCCLGEFCVEYVFSIEGFVKDPLILKVEHKINFDHERGLKFVRALTKKIILEKSI